MGNREAKDALFEAFAEVAKALGNGRRAEIVDVLDQGERSVEEIAREIDQSVANTSHHLQALVRAGLLSSRREGTRTIYALSSDCVSELWSGIREVAVESVAGIERLTGAYLGDRDDVESISRRELTSRLRGKDIIVLDVRPRREYEAGHIPGARSIPPDETRQRLRDLPIDVEVVAYCRGPFCVYADDAIRALRRRGITARRLEGGFPEWRRAGLAVATGTEGA
jgi:rhodanese-related sulfurtransferase